MDPRDPPAAGESVFATVKMSLGGTPFETEVEVPAGLAADESVLPLAHELTDAVIRKIVADTETSGRRISCRAGCGACCRQIVPVSQPEARRLAALIDGLPEPRRGHVLARFAGVRSRLEAEGLVAPLLTDAHGAGADGTPFSHRYFAMQVACPFLEDESCSIYADRPLACREYLVTSPAEFCAKVGSGRIDEILLPVRISQVVRRLARRRAADGSQDWVPLALVPEWVAALPASDPARTGAELVTEFFRLVSEFEAAHPEPPTATETSA